MLPVFGSGVPPGTRLGFLWGVPANELAGCFRWYLRGRFAFVGMDWLRSTFSFFRPCREPIPILSNALTKVPEGPSDNSPAFQRRVSIDENEPRAEGTPETWPASIPIHIADRNQRCVSFRTLRTLPQNCACDDALVANGYMRSCGLAVKSRL
jgi:hypothetical protein